MKGKPGRLRKPLPGPHLGHSTGTATQEPRVNGGDERGALVTQAVAPVAPRLLDLHAGAAYLCVSQWTLRDLEHSGIVPRVRVPLKNNGELRKLLFDRTELDRLVETWKDTTNNTKTMTRTMTNAGAKS